MKLSDKEWQVLEALWGAPEGLTLGQAVEASLKLCARSFTPTTDVPMPTTTFV